MKEDNLESRITLEDIFLRFIDLVYLLDSNGDIVRERLKEIIKDPSLMKDINVCDASLTDDGKTKQFGFTMWISFEGGK